MLVEPASGKDANQSWRNNGPAERADEGDIFADRPLAFSLPPGTPFSSDPDSFAETLLVLRWLRHKP